MDEEQRRSSRVYFCREIDSAGVNGPKTNRRRTTQELFFYFCPKLHSVPDFTGEVPLDGVIVSNLLGLVGTMDTDRTQTHRLVGPNRLQTDTDPRVATLTSVNLILCCVFFCMYTCLKLLYKYLISWRCSLLRLAFRLLSGHHKCHITGAALRFTRRSLASSL